MVEMNFMDWHTQGLSSGFLSQFAGGLYKDIDNLRKAIIAHKDEMQKTFGTFGEFSDFISRVAIQDCKYKVTKDEFGIFHRL